MIKYEEFVLNKENLESVVFPSFHDYTIEKIDYEYNDDTVEITLKIPYYIESGVCHDYVGILYANDVSYFSGTKVCGWNGNLGGKVYVSDAYLEDDGYPQLVELQTKVRTKTAAGSWRSHDFSEHIAIGIQMNSGDALLLVAKEFRWGASVQNAADSTVR